MISGNVFVIVKSLFDTLNEEKLTPQKTEIAKAAIEAIVELQKNQQEECAIFKEFQQSTPQVKTEPACIINLNVKNEKNETPLIWAAKRGHTDIVSLLIAKKAALDIRDSSGFTALIWAAVRDYDEVANKLIDAKASLDIKTNSPHDQTALMVASRLDHSKIQIKLIEAKASLDIQNHFNKDTALFYAARAGKTNTAINLIKAKAALDIKNKYGETALMCAASRGHFEIVRKLIKAKAELNFTNNHGITPLMWAAKHGHIRSVFKLIEYKASLIATNYRDLDVVSLILAHGAKIGDPTSLQTFLNSQLKNTYALQTFLSSKQIKEKVNFCLAVLNEQQVNLEKAKEYYELALIRHPYPPAYRRLGEMYEVEQNFSEAIRFYLNAAKKDELLSITRLVNVAQKLAKQTYFQVERKNIFHCKTLTESIYPLIISKNFHAALTSEQWLFLAGDAIGNPFFNSQISGIHFALRAIRNADGIAKNTEEKNEARNASINAWGIFRQVINPPHSMIDSKSEHQDQLKKFEEIAAEESVNIIAYLAGFSDDKNVKIEMSRTMFDRKT